MQLFATSVIANNGDDDDSEKQTIGMVLVMRNQDIRKVVTKIILSISNAITRRLAVLIVTIPTIYFFSSSIVYADVNKTENLEEVLWKKISSIINLEYGMLSHEKVEAIFGSKLDLIKKQDNSYQYLGKALSNDLFTVLVEDQKGGDGSRFVFHWDTKIDISHIYFDVTETPAPKQLCIKAFDRREDITEVIFNGRSNHYFNDRLISYLTFRNTQGSQVLDTDIYLDENNDCLLRVEIKSFIMQQPVRIDPIF